MAYFAIPGARTRPSVSRLVVADAPRVGARLPWIAIGTVVVALATWEAAVRATGTPAYLLPAPSRIAETLVARWPILWPEALVTFAEMVAGLVVGSSFGVIAALAMARSTLIERAAGPLLVITQALPTFALAPLLVLWLGFGFASKLAMTALVIFFPVATSFFEGLRRTDASLLDLARLNGAGPTATLRLIRIPSALPGLAAGLKVAAAGAPLGAIIGEWVGSSSGLGLLMLHANARMQTDLVFAALVVLVAFSLALWGLVGLLARRLVHWSPDTLPGAPIT